MRARAYVRLSEPVLDGVRPREHVRVRARAHACMHACLCAWRTASEHVCIRMRPSRGRLSYANSRRRVHVRPRVTHTRHHTVRSRMCAYIYADEGAR
jgi:hypothetical protein